jgi:hypothetical protein
MKEIISPETIGDLFLLQFRVWLPVAETVSTIICLHLWLFQSLTLSLVQ